MNVLKTNPISTLWFSAVILALIGGLLFFQAAGPASDRRHSAVFQIDKGMTLKQVASRLSDQKLIRGPNVFRSLAYLTQKQGQIKAGEFELSPSMSVMEILNRITSGKSILHRVTIPEGYRITEIAALLKGKSMADAGKFIQQTRDRSLIDPLDIPRGNLEGYLFPETYHFGKNTDERAIVKTMVDTFKRQALKPEYLDRARELGFSFHDIVTLASLIEKETGQEDERELISAVFHNRLRKNMRLQCDPTVIYALKNFDGNLRKKDLGIDSPYNTYRYSGLPPGPIANPGLKSIRAALYPASVDYIYFVSKQDGSHKFSSSLADHNRAVRKYQLGKSGRSSIPRNTMPTG